MKWALALVLASMFALPTGAAAQDGDAPPPPPGLFRKLMVTLGRDLKRLPSRENAVVLVNGAILAAAAYPFDDITTLGASSSPLLKRSFSGFGKALGREWVQGGGALAAYVAGHLWDKPHMIAAGGDLIEAQLVALTVTQGLKFAVGRTRPDGEARSFPSGHASAALATARVLHRHLGRRAAIPAYAIAVYTSVSRLQANSHYPSDVIAGAALGLAIAQTATIELEDARLQITPAVAPGSIAVVFTLR